MARAYVRGDQADSFVRHLQKVGVTSGFDGLVEVVEGSTNEVCGLQRELVLHSCSLERLRILHTFSPGNPTHPLFDPYGVHVTYSRSLPNISDRAAAYRWVARLKVHGRHLYVTQPVGVWAVAVPGDALDWPVLGRPGDIICAADHLGYRPDELSGLFADQGQLLFRSRFGGIRIGDVEIGFDTPELRTAIEAVDAFVGGNRRLQIADALCV